jgi:hypothetical protein
MEVSVHSPYVNGRGRIDYISNEAHYPIQVELHDPDADGHKMQRFHSAEVKPLRGEQDKKIDLDYPIVQFVKKFEGYSPFQLGECFVAKPTRLNRGTHYHLYKEDRFQGCFPVTYFKKVTPEEQHEVKKVDIKIVSMDIKVSNPTDLIKVRVGKDERPAAEKNKEIPKVKQKRKKEKNHFEQMEKEGQTSIFDFI